jgi:formylglycine-generating enzyme required for sulfatase activity
MVRFLCVVLVGAAGALVTADEPKVETNSVGMKFALVPAGKFLMGSPESERGRGDDERQHEVTITRPFNLGVHEVTQGQYAKVMGKNPSWFAPQGGGKQRVDGKNTADYPVDNVTWLDAVEFCKKLGSLTAEAEAGRSYRLPTEAEWEYACRAGTTTVFHYGDDLDAYKANFCGLVYAAYGKAGAGPFVRRTAAVGEYKPNAFGLYDMHGNVQEWCQDWYAVDAYPSEPQTDPVGPPQGTERVLRGGGWPHSGKSVRSAVRNKLAPDESHYSAGLRVVLMAR